ncbi:hypothetical protein ACS0TY_000420 [Phlomoides rotata]
MKWCWSQLKLKLGRTNTDGEEEEELEEEMQEFMTRWDPYTLAAQQFCVVLVLMNELDEGSRRMSFGLQLSANAQAAAEKNNCKKPLIENAKAGKKEVVKPKEETVIVITSDEESS